MPLADIARQQIQPISISSVCRILSKIKFYRRRARKVVFLTEVHTVCVYLFADSGAARTSQVIAEVQLTFDLWHSLYVNSSGNFTSAIFSQLAAEVQSSMLLWHDLDMIRTASTHPR